MAISVIKAKRAELVQFFQQWIPEVIPGMNIFLEGQSSPRPPYPYVSFRPISDIDYIGHDERRYDEQGNEFLRGQRVISCQLMAFTDSDSRHDGDDDAYSILQELRFSFGYASVIDLLSAITCRVVDEGDVIDVSEQLNTTNEYRAMLTFTLSTVIVQTPDSGQISTINATGAIEGINTINPVISVTKP